MAESKTVTMVPLNGSNYPTWKVQCRMALMKEGLWNIVNGTETAPGQAQAEKYAKFMSRRDKALATIVLSIEPSLLYLLGDPESPVAVWKKLSDQFQKKTWANKLELRRKLYSLRLKEGEPVQKHIKIMTEIFDSLSVIGDPVQEEDRVVHLLASLPESFNMLVTALEANPDIPSIEVVTERLLHEERKIQDRESPRAGQKAMTTHSKKKIVCHHCGKVGHVKRNCHQFLSDEKKSKSQGRQRAHQVTVKDTSESDGESDALMISHKVLSTSATSKWIVDSGATCHMCSDSGLFESLKNLKHPIDVSVGDGRTLKATGRGIVSLNMNLPDGKLKKRKLIDVLYVPKLSYNLLSVSKASENGKTTEFNGTVCRIFDVRKKLVAVATKAGSLYYLNCSSCNEQAAVVNRKSKEEIWHRRFGHLGLQNLQRLAREKLVNGYDFDVSKTLDFCESCIEGKHHKSHFSASSSRAKEPLDLVHSDVCGKLNAKSLGGAEYFLTFIDDCTHYTWVYVLKKKDEVFKYFLEWKALVEKSSGRKLNTLRTDNGGEYVSSKFEDYLKSEGIRHEFTVPKTPEQNGVAERMNRTLMETVRSMLADAKLPQSFWAECLSTAVYLRNRSPTKALEDTTPFEAWKKMKPVVDHLRVFGCDAYAHVPKDERKKLDSKSRKCIFLGYGETTKGYRLFDVNRSKVFHSRDVQFNEERSEVGQDMFKEGEEKRYVELEYTTDHHEDEVTSESHGSEDHDIDAREATSQQVVRRSERIKRAPDYFGERVNVINDRPSEPATLKEVYASPDKEKWFEAMEKEIKSLSENEVWDLVDLPEGRSPVGSKWVFKVKTGADGSIERYKARLVAQGYSQKFGTDYDETFCPVIRLESLRALIALAVQNDLELHQIDVTTAFLNGELEEEVYMKQPEGFIKRGKEHLVCKLKRSIYGLKQSPRCWNSVLDDQLKKMGFVQSESDPCIYRAKEEMFIIGVYVDDIVLATKKEKKLNDVKQALAKRFDIKDMGKLHYFLGMKVIHNTEANKVWIGQPAYTQNILQKFGMENAKPVKTPVDTSTKLVKATEVEESVDQRLYQSAVGSLLYLSVGTRPDIAYAVSNVAKFASHPTTKHWTEVKRIMRYLKGTSNLGLLYSKNASSECVGYSDSDWGGDLDDRKSTSGYFFQISGGPVSWRSKKQSCVALSTAEAEYMALASAGQEAVWMRQLTAELCGSPMDKLTLFEDNQSAIQMTKNPQFHGRTKHIEIKYHFIRELVSNKVVQLQYCPTEEMIADMLTKGLSSDQFSRLLRLAGVGLMPS